MLELLQTDQIVIRSIAHAIRNHVIEHGYYPNVNDFGDTPTDVALFKGQLDLIQRNKGFYVEVFSESSARNKGTKVAPRIVVDLDRTYVGEIGAPPNQLFKTSSNRWRSGSLPGRAANISIAVYLISHNSKQHYVINSIKDNVLGQRGFIPIYNDPNAKPFYVYQTGFYNNSDPAENITDLSYIYIAPDIFLGDNQIHRDDIKPIQEINVDIDPTQDNLNIK